MSDGLRDEMMAGEMAGEMAVKTVAKLGLLVLM